MIRNTALLTLLVFTFTLFAPAFMQPKEAEAVDACEVCKMVAGDPEVSGAITMVFEVLKVSTACLVSCQVIKNWLFNKCTAEGTKGCDGSTRTCNRDQDPKGCGADHCVCKKSDHEGTSTCTNDRCNNQGTYRNCVGHTCTTDLITGSYSGYW